MGNFSPYNCEWITAQEAPPRPITQVGLRMPHPTKIPSTSLVSHRPMPTRVVAQPWSLLIGPKSMSPSPLSARNRLVLHLRRPFSNRAEYGVPNSSPSEPWSEPGRLVASMIWVQPAPEAPPFGLDAAAGLWRAVRFLLHENTAPRRRDR